MRYRDIIVEAKVIDLPFPLGRLRVYVNPTRSALINLLTSILELRAVADDRNVYFFSAMQATHVQAERSLISAGLVDREYPFETIFLTPNTMKLSESYGLPRPFDDRHEMRCENRWDEVMHIPNFARLMPRLPIA